MKKLFRYLAAALLVGTSFAAASCSDDEPTPTPPQFPTQLPEQAILPGEVSSFTIKPNMDWKISIPEDALQWFYLLDDKGDDKQTKVTTLRGVAAVADQPITIKVGAENIEPFDFAKEPTVELTMTMGNPEETKVIASFKIEQQERELKFYPVKFDETGEYAFNEDEGSQLQYSYETEPKTEGSVKLAKHGAFYSARLLVESNASWTLSVPNDAAWVVVRVNADATATGMAGKSEVELRADFAKMPLEGATVACQFIAKKSDDSDVELAKIAVSLEDLTGTLECDLPAEALFSPRGNYLPGATLGASLNGSITAPNGAQIIAITQDFWGDYQQCDWVKPEIDEWSEGEQIQTRNVSITVDPQESRWDAQERQTDIFVLPATLKDKTVDDLLTDVKDGVREEYQKYRVTTITQEAPTFLLNAQNSKAMKEQGVKFELGTELFDSTLRQWNDWMQNDNALYYKLTYANEYSADGGALDIGSIPDGGPKNYTSYKIYGYNAGSVGENLPADNKWITLQETRNAVTNVVESIKVQMNFNDEYVNTYGDGTMKYAAIVFYDENDTAIATLECTYDDGAGSGGSTGAISFAHPQYAPMDGSTLEQLQAGDADYDKYANEYAAFNPSVYRVTFTTLTPTMSMIKGLPEYGQWCEVIDGADWLSRPEPGEEVTFAELMKSDKSAKGACIFYSGGANIVDGKVVDPQGPAVILVVNLVLGE